MEKGGWEGEEGWGLVLDLEAGESRSEGIEPDHIFRSWIWIYHMTFITCNYRKPVVEFYFVSISPVQDVIVLLPSHMCVAKYVDPVCDIYHHTFTYYMYEC